MIQELSDNSSGSEDEHSTNTLRRLKNSFSPRQHVPIAAVGGGGGGGGRSFDHRDKSPLLHRKAQSLDYLADKDDTRSLDLSLSSSSHGGTPPVAGGRHSRQGSDVVGGGHIRQSSDIVAGTTFRRESSDGILAPPSHRSERRNSGSSAVRRTHVRRMSDDIEWTSLGDKSGDELDEPSTSTVVSNIETKQLYLLVARCIAYPFNAKQQLETSPPKPKLNSERFCKIERTISVALEGGHNRTFEGFLTPGEQRCLRSDRFLECVRWFKDNVLVDEDVVRMCQSGSFSAKELELIFKVRAMKVLTFSSATRQLDTSEHQVWLNTFRKLIEHCSQAFSSCHTPPSSRSPTSPGAAGTAPNQDKLYRLFQNILGVKTIEHTIIYRECQLGIKEEQEAVVRRELQNRVKVLEDRSSMLEDGRFGSHKVEEIYREEQLKMVKQLNANIDHLSLSGTGFSPAMHKKSKRVNESGNITVTKHDLHLQLKVKVTVHEATQVPKTDGKPVFCVFELVDSSDPYQTQVVVPEYSSAKFEEEREFWTQSPLPQIKFTLFQSSKRLFSDYKPLGKKVHVAMPSSSDIYAQLELLRNDKDTATVAKLKISTLVERPTSMKKCGYLSCSGDYMFKQLRRRFFALMQLSQYKFLLCTYQPGGTQPKEHLLLEDFTVEYASEEDQRVHSQDTDALCMFVLVSEMSELGRIRFGCRDNAERESWMQWMVRATGQSYQPQLSVTESLSGATDLERYGLTEVVHQDATQLCPHGNFVKLFRHTLDYRLKEDVFSRGLFSPQQMYVLDEFCARYGVRDPFRHLACLREWLERESRNEPIWPVMMLSSFRFCQMHVGGMNPPEKSVIVTKEEQEALVQVSQTLEEVVLRKIRNFRKCFPFGCPKDDLKVTIKLFNLVASMNHSGASPNSEESPLKILVSAMERAALTNYKQIFKKLQVKKDSDVLPMSSVFCLAQLCIDFMYELHDFYWEDFTPVASIFTSHIDTFWSFFLVDVRESMKETDDIIAKLQLFHIVNQYFCSQPTMKQGLFHLSFLDEFVPTVESYIDGLENTLTQDLFKSFTMETWLPVSQCCAAVEGALNALFSLKRFLEELSWPQEPFASQLQQRVGTICARRCHEAAQFTLTHLKDIMASEETRFSFVLPLEVFTMLNTLVYLNAQVMQVCSTSRGKSPDVDTSEEMQSASDQQTAILQEAIAIVIDKLCRHFSVLLEKLAKFDPADSFLAKLKRMLPGSVPVDAYRQFLQANLQLISNHLVHAVFNNVVVNWYECQLQLLQEWLSPDKRAHFSLDATQRTVCSNLMEMFQDLFSGYELPTQQLESPAFQAIEDRLRIEASQVDLLTVGKG